MAAEVVDLAPGAVLMLYTDGITEGRTPRGLLRRAAASGPRQSRAPALEMQVL
jgi:serine phosphatase RsbU (regulator of sigma subunit)